MILAYFYPLGALLTPPEKRIGVTIPPETPFTFCIFWTFHRD